MKSKTLKLILFASFVATVWGANWALERYGFVRLIGPWEIIVPAGVYFAGLAFGLRDALHAVAGRAWVFAAILTGGALAWWIEPTFAVASATAFIVAELADLAVYEPLRQRSWTGAVALSNVVGSVVDSLLFLHIAFGSTFGWLDLTFGKALMILPSIAIMWVVRRLVGPNPEPPADLTVMVLGDS